MKLILGTFTVLAILVFGSEAEEGAYHKKVVCYFGSWAVYRWGNGKFDVEQIDPYICTHLIFGFTGLSPLGTIQVLDPYNDLEENWGRGALKRMNDFKKINPFLKTLIAIGGWNEGSETYSQMASTPERRKIFIDSALEFVRRHGYDGLDLDWEYPAHRGGVPDDKINFASLVREMRVEFDKYGLLITAAVSAGQLTIEAAYDIPSVARNLDFINIMTYDFHGAWETWASHHSALYALPEEDGTTAAMLNMNHSVHFWLSMGAPKEKLVLGMGLYGRGFTLDDPTDNVYNASASSGIPAGPYTQEVGFWGFLEICEKQLEQSGQWTVVRPEYVVAPYAYNNKLWIGYDDPESIRRKAEFILEMDLGGGMVWSIDTDDFVGNCHGEKFPLIKTMHRTLNGEIIIPPPPPTTTEDPNNTKPTTTSTPPPPPPDDICKKEGMNADPTTPCSAIFYQCINVGGTWTAYALTCASGTIFNPLISACTYPDEVPGCS